jgi:hypothetical protein
MPDISMCLNEHCPLRKTCYRFTAKPSYYQSYSMFHFNINDKNKPTCEFYCPAKNPAKHPTPKPSAKQSP